jgi:GR25 family glycosyltransferase involved in LPS biosynthesis
MKVFSRKIQAITLLLATTASLLFTIKTHYEASRSMDAYIDNLRHSHMAPHDLHAAEDEPVATTTTAPSVKLRKEGDNVSLRSGSDLAPDHPSSSARRNHDNVTLRKEADASCQKLPHIHWINLDESKERRESFLKSAESVGIVNQHRVAAYDSKQVAALIDSKQVIFHPQIKFYAGDGQMSYLKHPDNIYVFNEAACLLSHLQAIKQAYDSGHELAFIAEDDASFSDIFCDEFHAYLALAPKGWKVLQFATNNPHVVQHGSFLSEPFISWQRYHHSTRAYLINRAGMETLLGKLHSTTSTGRSMWRVEEFPSLVADEAIYTLTGDTYYSLDFGSIQQHWSRQFKRRGMDQKDAGNIHIHSLKERKEIR